VEIWFAWAGAIGSIRRVRSPKILPSLLVALVLVAGPQLVTAADAGPPDVPAKPAPVRSGEPYENFLGMKFVPVPSTAVLFGVWDVRVQDYQAFVAATGHGDDPPSFEQGPTHPVVNVSWSDAQDFCAWLTQKERLAGRLDKNQSYRLPTDAEWSIAAGLDEPHGGTPRSKDRQIKNVYPWGADWPPPKDAGNYDGSLRVDTFKNTSPVGSFAPNKNGLYDMGGNVWQWCQDFFDGKSGSMVVRGGSFMNVATDNLLLSRRDSYDADTHYILIGFRVVIATEGSVAP
jgi:formylglycine-generating enzyme required for sulfatase activity